MSVEHPSAATPHSPVLLGEIIGLPIRILEAPGIRPLPMEGVVADESLHMLRVRRAGMPRDWHVPKAGLRAILVKDGDEVPLNGEALRVRPEDRTKLLALGGRRRMR